MDLGGHRGEQRGDRGFFGDGLGDQVHRAGAVEEGGDVEPVAGAGQDGGGQGRVGHEGQGSGHDHPDGGRGLVGFGAEFGQGVGPLAGAGGEQDPLGDVRVGAGHPGRDRAQVVAGQGGGTEVAAQVVAGLGGPERAVLHALLGHGERERVGAADRGGRVLAARDRVPAEGGGHAADVLGVEHVHPAVLGAHRGGQRVQVGFGAGGDDRAGVAQDDIGQEGGLMGARGRHDQQVLLERDPQAVPVVRPAQEHRVLVRSGDPVPQREQSADPAGAAQRGQPAPAQPQAEQVGEALARVQPQVQPDAQVPGPVAGQVPGGQERPRERGSEQDYDEQGDGVFGDHRGSPLRAARTALRRAARAAPVFRPAAGARAALIARRDQGEWRREGRTVR